MKLVKTASGKKTIKMSKKEWQAIGKKAGWMRIAYEPWKPFGIFEDIDANEFDFYDKEDYISRIKSVANKVLDRMRDKVLETDGTIALPVLIDMARQIIQDGGVEEDHVSKIINMISRFLKKDPDNIYHSIT
jgi:hypothetical protein